MWIQNTDKEVEKFHPVCKHALEVALEKLGLSDFYEVQHHRFVGTIEMDLVIANRKTQKILFVVEVKRTIAAVNSTRYQYQAMSYVQSLSEAEIESKYYLLTNLESSCLFKFDARRPNVYEQIIYPGFILNHRFADVSQQQFMDDLIDQYAKYISVIISDNGHYLLSFQQFVNEIQGKVNKDLEWKKTLVGLFYEYIRGSFTKVGRTGLKTIAQLSNKADLVCREGLQVNFVDIFSLPRLKADERNIGVSNTLLNQLFELGRTYVDADELANVMHKVVSEKHRHEGEVSTDIELATIMLWIVRCLYGELGEGEKIMDPAAGSGSLLCATVSVFKNIQPSQIVANDINEKLLQLLSLRIGLKFATTIEKNNTARITVQNVADLPTSDFDNVKILVLNPPYLSSTGLKCTERKNKLYQRIREIKGAEPTTESGQMPLEGPFVELVSTLAKEDTLIAAILPNSHFTTKGEASKAIRTMLLEDFGLQMIFNYPQKHLFDDVVQNTSIVIGRKGVHYNYVRYLYCNEAISEIDPATIGDVLAFKSEEKCLTNINSQFEGCLLSCNFLTETLESGWQIGNMSRQDAQNFVKYNLVSSPFLISLADSEFNHYERGKVGNYGCADLLYFSHDDDFLTQNDTLLKGHTAIGLNRARYSQFMVGKGESVFIDATKMSDDQISAVVDAYLSRKCNRNRRQRRNDKSHAEYREILKFESVNSSPAHCVMLPRSIRSQGRVFVSDESLYVSTNFFVIHADEDSSRILGSWFSTIFYQLECEAYGNNRGGLRKMEKKDYDSLHVPIISQLKEDQRKRIISTPVTEFVNLRTPEIREVDRVWAEILFGEKSEEFLSEAVTLVSILVADREK